MINSLHFKVLTGPNGPHWETNQHGYVGSDTVLRSAGRSLLRRRMRRLHEQVPDDTQKLLRRTSSLFIEDPPVPRLKLTLTAAFGSSESSEDPDMEDVSDTLPANDVFAKDQPDFIPIENAAPVETVCKSLKQLFKLFDAMISQFYAMALRAINTQKR